MALAVAPSSNAARAMLLVRESPLSFGGTVEVGEVAQAQSIHEEVYTVFGNFGAIHTPDWHHFQNVRGNGMGKGPCLYDLKADPAQTKNVLRDFPEMAKQLRGKLENHLKIEIPPLKV
jgi:hypothetical protein